MEENRLKEISDKLGSYGLNLKAEVEGKFKFYFMGYSPAIVHYTNDYKLQAEVYELLSELFKYEAEYMFENHRQYGVFKSKESDGDS